MKRAKPRGVRLDLPDPLGADLLDVRYPVRESALLEIGQPAELGVVHRDDDLPAALERDAVFLGEAL